MTNVSTEKRKPRFDFSTLSDPVSVQSARKWATDPGQRSVLELPIHEVLEDPNNPRKAFNEEALQGLANSIKARGVMQPILVRERGLEGKFVIIQGARRFRGSLIAGKTTVPAIVIPASEMAAYDDYSQVVENIQRENLSAEEVCDFIVKRLAAGDKKGEIADQLGIRPQAISAYLAIDNLPTNVLALFRSGKINGIDPLYDFTRLQAKAPEVAERLIAEAEQHPLNEITKSMIRAELKALDETETPVGQQLGDNTLSQPLPASSEPGTQGGEARLTESATIDGKQEQNEVADSDAAIQRNETVLTQQPGIPDNMRTIDATSIKTTEGGHKTEQTADTSKVVQLPFHNTAKDKPSGDGRMPDPNFIKKPLLLGRIDGDPVKLLLTRRPTASGLIHISWEHTGLEEEVALDRIMLTLLSDMKVQETA